MRSANNYFCPIIQKHVFVWLSETAIQKVSGCGKSQLAVYHSSPFFIFKAVSQSRNVQDKHNCLLSLYHQTGHRTKSKNFWLKHRMRGGGGQQPDAGSGTKPIELHSFLPLRSGDGCQRIRTRWRHDLLRTSAVIDCLADGAVSSPPAEALSGALVFYSITIRRAPGWKSVVFTSHKTNKDISLIPTRDSLAGWLHWLFWAARSNLTDIVLRSGLIYLLVSQQIKGKEWEQISVFLRHRISLLSTIMTLRCADWLLARKKMWKSNQSSHLPVGKKASMRTCPKMWTFSFVISQFLGCQTTSLTFSRGTTQVGWCFNFWCLFSPEFSNGLQPQSNAKWILGAAVYAVLCKSFTQVWVRMVLK